MDEQQRILCAIRQRATWDALEVIQGKWRIPIVISLMYGYKRFGEIKRNINEINDTNNISPKMLSQELKELESFKLVTREEIETVPVSVEYSLTPLGKSLIKMLDELLDWGTLFRKEIMSD